MAQTFENFSSGEAGLNDPFVDLCLSALAECRSSAHDELKRKFGSAYAHRSQFPWLGESGTRFDVPTGFGLSYAIASALSTYAPHRDRIESPQLDVVAVDRITDDEFDTALSQLPYWSVKLGGFGHALRSAGVDATKASREVVSQHVIQAVAQYIERADHTGSDPW